MTTPERVPEPGLPTEIANYRIERVLGTGGMGVVYLAQNPTLHRREALKVLSADLVDNAAARETFVREAVNTSALDHPNIVNVFSRGEAEDGRPWIAMEYVAGTDAEAALRNNAMTVPRALHIIAEAARALDYAHQRGVIHQDIKPANILLGHRGGGEPERVVLGDFGAALTVNDVGDVDVDGAMVASFAYTAPEAILGCATIDRRADVYSLGCTLFRLLTGRVPFPDHDSAAAIAHAHLEQKPPRISDVLPWATTELDAVIANAMAKDPGSRYHTAGELAAAATRALRWPRPVHVAPRVDCIAPPPRVEVSPIGASRPPMRVPTRGWVVGGGIAGTVLVIGLLAWMMLPGPAPAASPTAADHTTSSTPTVAPPAGRLTRLLPAGYPSGSCAPAPAAGAAAVIACGQNLDSGGPSSATYTLAANDQSLQAALARIISTSRTVVCPGNIQSPGPWRHVADPAVPKGTVFCGLRSGRPVVAWTLDSERLLALAESAVPDAVGLNGLYAWWAAHS